jgi:hypothetical protein
LAKLRYELKLPWLNLWNINAYEKKSLKNAIFWDVTSCSPLKVNRRFGKIFRLHLQGRKISRAGNQQESRWQEENRCSGIYEEVKLKDPVQKLRGSILTDFRKETK